MPTNIRHSAPPARAVWSAVSLLALTASCVVPSGDDSQVERVSSAQSLAEIPPNAAAVEVLTGSRHDTWFIACDKNNQLQFIIKQGISHQYLLQPVLDSSCVGTPAIVKWDHPADADHSMAYSTVAVYGLYLDGHLWELYFSASTTSGAYFWADLSNDTGFGPIIDSPVIADVTAAGDVSVLAKAPGNFLHTFDYFGGAWSTRPVKFASGGTMTTLERVSAQTSAVGVPLLTGRGFDATNPTQGWIARRTGSWNNSYVNYRSLNNGGGTLFGTPAIYKDRVFATFGADKLLKSRAASALSNADWTAHAPSCKFGGSPVAPPEIVSGGFNGVSGHGRNPSGGMMWWVVDSLICGSASLGALDFMGTSPAWVLGDTETSFRADYDFIYSSSPAHILQHHDSSDGKNRTLFVELAQ